MESKLSEARTSVSGCERWVGGVACCRQKNILVEWYGEGGDTVADRG